MVWVATHAMRCCHAMVDYQLDKLTIGTFWVQPEENGTPGKER